MPAEKSGLVDEASKGNGSLMRIHPFSLMAYYNHNTHVKWEEYIEKASALTHAHERSKLACKIYTLILFNLLKIPKKAAIKVALNIAKYRYFKNPEYSHFERLFNNSYKECVLKAVNFGEDTDTVAAIAGGLAGALYGYDDIPPEWRDVLIKREYIEAICERAAGTW